MATETGCDLEQPFKANLYLETKPSPSLKALKRIHDIVSSRCFAQKPPNVRFRTSGHYTYSISSLEFEYRQTVIEALISNGDYMNANFYLRFWAYSLSRCPIVLEEALDRARIRHSMSLTDLSKNLSRLPVQKLLRKWR